MLCFRSSFPDEEDGSTKRRKRGSIFFRKKKVRMKVGVGALLAGPLAGAAPAPLLGPRSTRRRFVGSLYYSYCYYYCWVFFSKLFVLYSLSCCEAISHMQFRHFEAAILVYIHVCMFAYIYACKHTFIHTFINVYKHVCMRMKM